MARIAGVNIPREKRVEIGLTYIYGIGRTTARAILGKAGIDVNKKVQDLTDDEVALALPGDELLPDAVWVVDRATTLDAPPARVLARGLRQKFCVGEGEAMLEFHVESFRGHFTLPCATSMIARTAR